MCGLPRPRGSEKVYGGVPMVLSPLEKSSTCRGVPGGAGEEGGGLRQAGADEGGGLTSRAQKQRQAGADEGA